MTVSRTRIAIGSLTAAILIAGAGAVSGPSLRGQLSLKPCSYIRLLPGCGAATTTEELQRLSDERVCGPRPAPTQCADGGAPMYSCNRSVRMWNRQCPPSQDRCGDGIPTSAECRQYCVMTSYKKPGIGVGNGCAYVCDADCQIRSQKINTCGNGACEAKETAANCPRDCTFSQITGNACNCPRMMTWDGEKCVQATEELCPVQEATVCGCDEKTYRNSCNARKAGVKSYRAGACGSVGTQFPGATCGNRRCEPPWENFETCTLDCPSIEGDACRCPFGEMWDSQNSRCTANVADVSCDMMASSLVCGCDGRTYGSPCQAHMGGLKSVEDGRCPLCGDRVCNGLETHATCPKDCTTIPPVQPQPATCIPRSCPQPRLRQGCILVPGQADANGCATCPTVQCTTPVVRCGDKVCSPGENPGTCPMDCPLR